MSSFLLEFKMFPRQQQQEQQQSFFKDLWAELAVKNSAETSRSSIIFTLIWSEYRIKELEKEIMVKICSKTFQLFGYHYVMEDENTRSLSLLTIHCPRLFEAARGRHHWQQKHLTSLTVLSVIGSPTCDKPYIENRVTRDCHTNSSKYC